MSRFTDQLTSGVTVLALGSALWLLAAPGGGLRKPVDEWRAHRADRLAVQANWPLFAGSPRLGRGTGPVTLVEFADFECPACRAVSPMIDSVLASNPGMSIAYVNLPLSVHPHAIRAAVAAVCADRQDRFAAYHRQLFTSNRWLIDEDWTREAVAAGITDTTRFQSCLSDSTALRVVREGVELAEELRITATPTFLSPSSRLVGTVPAESLLTFAVESH
jgi:protein-disulfide isomerase